jgi:hypothetical protein
LVNAEAHGSHEVALKYGELTARKYADQHQLAGLVGREREAHSMCGKPISETTRGTDGVGLNFLVSRLRFNQRTEILARRLRAMGWLSALISLGFLGATFSLRHAVPQSWGLKYHLYCIPISSAK